MASQTTTFKPNETVYVSALNNARGDGTIPVRWYMGSQLLSEREKHVSFKGAGATEFNISSAERLPARRLQRRSDRERHVVGTRNFNVTK